MIKKQKNREKLLQILLTKLMRTIKNVNQKGNFPWGDYLLTRQQIMILFFIAEKNEGVVVKDLAKFLGVTPGAVTQFIDALVDYKLVNRQVGIKDKRLTRIKLSSLAKIKFQKFKKDYLKSATLTFNNLSDQELEKFIQLLEKIKV